MRRVIILVVGEDMVSYQRDNLLVLKPVGLRHRDMA